MEGVFAVFMVFSIPLSAVLGTVYLKSLKLKASSGPDPELARRLAALEARNADLQSRVEVLETIVTGDEYGASRPARVRVAAGGSHGAESAVADTMPASGGVYPGAAQRR